MRDEDYQPDQIGEYGVGAQPALVSRMRPHLRMTQLGNALALLAVVTAVVALVRFPDFGNPAGTRWAVTAVVCAVLLLLICSCQHLCWLRGMARWSGRSEVRLEPLMRVSWIVHLVSYAVLLVALWATISAVVQVGWMAWSAVLLSLSLVFMLAAQVMAAVQYLRVSGPPGTLPAHMRRLAARERSARLGR
ncbi:MAG TPA: hypothetical protein VFP89_13545 [Propionibacteriaceae bacterium]|nr:hypothetical protein [Propionibacteriaceae bacterium]